MCLSVYTAQSIDSCHYLSRVFPVLLRAAGSVDARVGGGRRCT